MIDLQLNTGNIVSLRLLRRDDNLFELIDDNNQVQMILKLDGNHFVVKDFKNISEERNGLEIKLENLYRKFKNEENSGVESDEGDDYITDPFNPEEISIDTVKFSMDSCLRRLVQGTINLNPDFQRQEVWTPDKKSRLIESFMLKIPIPMFYVSSDEKSKLIVVDGLQRFSTIRDFILGKRYLDTKNEEEKGVGFRLQDLEFWKEYEGMNFKELPTNIVNRILETEFTFTIINPRTPEEVRRNIFKRINTGGEPLSNQEIRNDLYIGQETSILKELASLDEFKKATDYSVKTSRMEDKELVLRFISFLVRDHVTYKKTINIDTWLSDTMIIVNALPELETKEFLKLSKRESISKEMIDITDLDAMKKSFTVAMKRAYKLFNKHAFRKSHPGIRRAPINKALFETWGVLLSRMSDVSFEKLYSNKDSFFYDYKTLIDDQLFVLTISRHSMHTASVKSRFEKINELINKYSHD
jgi:uncharacterized protein with ParB-like and HNH nuclease domain